MLKRGSAMKKVLMFIILILLSVNALALTAEILNPVDGTGWGVGEEIFFRGNGSDGTPPYTYYWDFGDDAVNLAHASERTEQYPSNVNYTVEGAYTVNLTVDDELANIITINMFDLGKSFTCAVKTSCGFSEIEMVKLNTLGNAHIDNLDTLKVEYNETVCCWTTTLIVNETSTPSTVGFYAGVSDLATYGSNLINKGYTNTRYYELASYVGTDINCTSEYLGVSGSCSDTYGKECVYEFFSFNGMFGESHLAECGQHSFGLRTYGMCCDVIEDCTNNLDDDGDGYADCVDPDCHVEAKVCGASSIEGTFTKTDPILGEVSTDYYCSKGVNELYNPLPGYVADLKNDAAYTRHCCEAGTKWLPDQQICGGESAPCYISTGNPLCTKDFNTELLEWGYDAVNDSSQDCVFDATDIFRNVPVKRACCPLHVFGEDTYDDSYIVAYYQIV